MKRCAFLSTDDLTDFVFDDDLAIPPLAERGWAVETVPWRAGEDWSRFDMVVIRTAWDYQDEPDAFLAALERIERAGTRLENPLATVRWNLRKTYLRELEATGVPIVPTQWIDALEPGDLAACLDRVVTDGIIVKPVVGANADDTFRLEPDTVDAMDAELVELFRGRAAMVQPFLTDVVATGEYSVVYMNGRYSHSLLKTPAEGDFRVQEEHGARVRGAHPGDQVLTVAERAMAAIPGRTPLYARADLLRHPDLGYVIGELELIEPALYLRLDPGAPARFADAVAARSGTQTPEAPQGPQGIWT